MWESGKFFRDTTSPPQAMAGPLVDLWTRGLGSSPGRVFMLCYWENIATETTAGSDDERYLFRMMVVSIILYVILNLCFF